uniref:Uncharacterized protein n=1 Tax=Meloidogyne javanica TaxID=6303 RepID=A0A915LG17_MELJA
MYKQPLGTDSRMCETCKDFGQCAKYANEKVGKLLPDIVFWYKQYDPLRDRKVYIGLHGLEGCEEETSEGEYISPVPKCTHYKKPSFYEKYACHCGNPNPQVAGINKEVSDCWAAFPDPPNVNICISCYMDEARNHASEPIKALTNIRTIFEDQIEKGQQLIINGYTENNKEIVVRMDVAIFSVEHNHAEIDKIDKYFAKFFNETQDTVVQYTKTAKKYEDEKRKSEAEAYMNLASYKNIINNLAIVEYLKERKLTFIRSEKLLKDIRALKELLKL